MIVIYYLFVKLLLDWYAFVVHFYKISSFYNESVLNIVKLINKETQKCEL